jgi:hypothetical protein
MLVFDILQIPSGCSAGTCNPPQPTVAATGLIRLELRAQLGAYTPDYVTIITMPEVDLGNAFKPHDH